MSSVSTAPQIELLGTPPQKARRQPIVAGDILRDVIEILQLSSTASVVVLEVVGGDLETAKVVVSALGDKLPNDTVIGRISEARIGIVLPQMTSFKTQLLIESARASGELPDDCEFTVWTSESNWEAGARSVFAMYAKPTPTWKRAMDIMGASIVLAAVAPILLVSGIAIRLTSAGPVVFKQQRVGRGGRKFYIYKLRTMRCDAEMLRAELSHFNESTGLAFKIKDDPRITRVGKWLRKLSIDELPQLYNVLRGEMSLVGPRPLPVADWQPTVSWHCRRHDIAPGLTGIWQVSGRCEVDFDAWVDMDLEYIRRQSLLFDCLLLLKTIPAVFTSTGAV